MFPNDDWVCEEAAMDDAMANVRYMLSSVPLGDKALIGKEDAEEMLKGGCVVGDVDGLLG